MSIALEKRAESVGIILAKAGVTKIPPVRVGLALDVSGSAKHLYESGIIQQTIARLIPIAMKFDDNGELDMWSFSSGVDQLESASAADETTYVKENILGNDEITLWQGTEYAPVLSAMVEFWYPSADAAVEVEAPAKPGLFGRLFGKAVAPVVVAPAAAASVDAHGQSLKVPAMGLIITDGECSDSSYAARVLAGSQDKNVYWQMVGVGPSHNFKFLQQQADLLPNVGFVNLSSLDISDDELYGELIAAEFIDWVKKIPVA